jgi:uncharacterized membrane protein (DUF373 family)
MMNSYLIAFQLRSSQNLHSLQVDKCYHPFSQTASNVLAVLILFELLATVSFAVTHRNLGESSVNHLRFIGKEGPSDEPER